MAQNERIDKLSESVNQSQITVQDTAELVQTILVGMENLGENFKQLQENMDYWHMPENPNAETEHQKLNEELLREVFLLVPVVSRPIAVGTNPVTSFPQVFAPLSSSPQAEIFPQPAVRSTNEDVHSEWVIGTALSKPYPGAPTLPATTGFNSGELGQDIQAKGSSTGIQTTIPKFFQMGSTSKPSKQGHDGQPRRITPIPISSGQILSDEAKEGYAQVAKTIFGAKVPGPTKISESTELFSGASKPTIGETSISTQEAERIEKRFAQ